MQEVLWVVVAAFLTFFPGCCGPSIPLEKRWRPPTHVTQSPFTHKDLYFTVSSHVYVRDLEQWKKDHPPGYSRNLILIHERIHAYRQSKQGIVRFINCYIFSKSYRWNEELLATYAEMQYMKSQGRKTFNFESTANTFSGEGYFHMVSKEKALRQLKRAWYGHWKPKPGELPDDLGF